MNIGDSIITFDLPGTDGETYSPSTFEEKAALAVVFTCNHCPYALAWEPRLLDIQRDYADKGVQLIGISANDADKYPADSFDNMKAHAQDNEWNFPYLYDESQEIANAFGAKRTPEVFLFDKDGTLQYQGTIDDNYEDPESVQNTYFRDAIDAVLAGEHRVSRPWHGQVGQRPAQALAVVVEEGGGVDET
ncbi:MAG: thioredoxin family protein, partial [Chloroflexota bacterium]